MKEVDYIIVGLGLAGIAFCEECERAAKSFVVFDKGVKGASRVAAGLYNPVILKRYSLPWKAVEQFDLAIPYYRGLEHKLDSSFMRDMPVRKVLVSVEDQNNWFVASDKPSLKRFVKTAIVKVDNHQMDAPFNYGEVQETGRVDIKKLQTAYEAYLDGQSAFAKAKFDYSKIILKEQTVTYEGYTARHIIFAEGYGIKNNPYFNRLPLVGNKGEYLTIKAPELQLTAVLKTSIFIVPLGEDLYKIGATFNWQDKNWQVTEEARQELVAKFDKLVTTPYTIVNQEAGMRPTTGDRRPLLGSHPKHRALVVLNGLGTRGIMASPLLAGYLFRYLEQGVALPEEVDIMRFPKKLV